MEILKLSRKNLTKAVKETARIIKQGKVVILPTDTVYGLAADAASKKAVSKIFKIKQRTNNKPLPLFVKNIREVKKFAKINKKQEIFLKKVWPGKTTVILERKKGKKIYGVGKENIGLRIPKYKLITILLRKLNRPLVGTSANLSGKPASTKIKEVIKQFKNMIYRPDLIIDAGNLPKSRPSKVVDIREEKIKILRK